MTIGIVLPSSCIDVFIKIIFYLSVVDTTSLRYLRFLQRGCKQVVVGINNILQSRKNEDRLHVRPSPSERHGKDWVLSCD